MSEYPIQRGYNPEATKEEDDAYWEWEKRVGRRFNSLHENNYNAWIQHRFRNATLYKLQLHIYVNPDEHPGDFLDKAVEAVCDCDGRGGCRMLFGGIHPAPEDDDADDS